MAAVQLSSGGIDARAFAKTAGGHFSASSGDPIYLSRPLVARWCGLKPPASNSSTRTAVAPVCGFESRSGGNQGNEKL